jgi:hypothetical protein
VPPKIPRRPIELPDGRKLKTLAEAMAWLAKEVPKSEHKMEKVQTAAHLVTRAAEHGGRMIFAQMGMLQAIHRHLDTLPQDQPWSVVGWRFVCKQCGAAGSVNIVPNWHDRINSRTPFQPGWKPWW